MPYRNKKEVSPLWGKLVFGIVGTLLLTGGILLLLQE